MKSSKDNEIARIENDSCEMIIYSVIGNRNDQQDTFGFMNDKTRLLCVVADGMGGHKGGKKASNIVVDNITQTFSDINEDNVNDCLCTAIKKSDLLIGQLADDSGKTMGAGSTLVSVYLDGRNLHWVSVGDSRAYLFRNGKYAKLTKDQNYQTVLQERKKAGIISDEEYEKENRKGDGLINYIGIGNIDLVDHNNRKMELQSGDLLMLMSDGVYKIISEDEINRIINNIPDIKNSIQIIESKLERIASQNNIKRDNTTLAIIRVK